MSRLEAWIYGILMVCAIALGFIAAWEIMPTQTIIKIKPRTIVCLVNNQQAVASCTRVERK